jgi:hypothetical protein
MTKTVQAVSKKNKAARKTYNSEIQKWHRFTQKDPLVAKEYKQLVSDIKDAKLPRQALADFRKKFQDPDGMYSAEAKVRNETEAFKKSEQWLEKPKTMDQLVAIYHNKATATRVATWLENQGKKGWRPQH